MMETSYYLARTTTTSPYDPPKGRVYLIQAEINRKPKEFYWMRIWWQGHWHQWGRTKEDNYKKEHWRPIESSKNLINFYQAIL